MTEIESIVDSQKLDEIYAGLAIGIVDGADEQMLFRDFSDGLGTMPITKDTIFEIGSVTKVFAATLLAQFVVEEKTLLDDRAAGALPPHVTLPNDGESEITFRNLANHRSGLPRLPANLDLTIVEQDNPYAGYTVENLYEYLQSLETLPERGSNEEYSNLGYGLLGHLLGRIDESNFDQALSKHVLIPLGLNETTIQLSQQQLDRLAQPHVARGLPTKPWEFQDSTVAAGGLHASLPDMMKFVKACLHPDQTPIVQAIELTQQPAPTTERVTNWQPWYRYWIVGILVAASILCQWALDIQPGGASFAVAIFVPILLGGILGGRLVGVVTTALLTLIAWLLHGNEFNWAMTLFLGGLISMLVHRTSGRRRPKNEGRLGWHEMTIDNREILWHNGMVGGSASFLAFCPALDRGLVILTNTAIEVDSLGQLILYELVAEK